MRHDQPATGFRSGIEPVLLAAAVPARPGQRVLELGCGAGAALLCLAERVPGLLGVGVERDPVVAGLMAANAALNGWADRLWPVVADVAALPLGGGFDHALANPPYHIRPGTRSPSSARDLAKRGDAGTLAVWTGAMATRVRHRGTVTLILPADHLAESLAAMTGSGCAVATLVPLWRGPNREARLVIVQGVRGGRMPMRLHPGLTLHAAGGGYTEAARSVLEDGASLWDAAPT